MKPDETERERSAKAVEAGLPTEHHCVYCPNCSLRLTEFRCKLVCPRCGYYLSCADYY